MELLFSKKFSNSLNCFLELILRQTSFHFFFFFNITYQPKEFYYKAQVLFVPEDSYTSLGIVAFKLFFETLRFLKLLKNYKKLIQVVKDEASY